jgi:hypothetical protein
MGDQRLERGFLDETRDAHLDGVVGDGNVEQVRQVADRFQHGLALLGPAPILVVDLDADGDGTCLADRLLGLLEHLAQQPQAIG